MAYIGNQPALQYITFAKQTFTANGSTVAFTLDNSVANENELEVFVNNVRQEPGSGKAYTASGTTLTMSAAPNTGDDFYCIYQGRATGTVTPGNGTVLNAHLVDGAITSAKLATNIDVSGTLGIGETSPLGKLHVKSADSGASVNSGHNQVIAENSGNSGFTILSGTSSNGAICFGDSGNNCIGYVNYGHNGDHLDFGVNNAERMRIDSSGNVGIGTSSPQTKLEAYSSSNGGVITAHRNSEVDGDYTGYEFHTNSSSTQFKKGAIYFRANGTGYGRGDIVFCNDRIADGNNVTLSDEKLRIADTGRIHTNTTTSPNGHLNLIGERGGSYRAIQFEHTNGGGAVGNITTGSSSVAYNTSSDYRLKENVVDLTNATERLKQLQPKRFNFISDADTTVDGFLAHEVSSIVPEAISGTKDAVQVWEEGDELPEGVSVGDNKLDENGNTIPEYQGIDQAKLVPLLVKTIQELEARIAALES